MGLHQPAGYGSFRWPCPPIGAQRETQGSSAEYPTITTTQWTQLLRDGHSSFYHVTVDGIPWVFSQRRLMDIRGREVGAPADYAICHALFIDESMEVSIDCDRESGLAAGRAVDIKLAWRELEDEGVAAAIFRRPTVMAALSSSITSHTTTSFPVASTSGIVAGTGYYLGAEYVVPASVDSAALSLEGVRRGVCGRPHYHTSKTGSGYRYVTDAPMFWRGRLVTIWETLISPEGRGLGEGPLATLGPFTRHRWRGYIDDNPKPAEEGMILRCLPLVRALSTEVGYKLSGEINFDEQGFPFPLGFDATDQVHIQEQDGTPADIVAPNNPGNIYCGSIQLWAALCQQNAAVNLPAGDTLQVRAHRDRWALKFVAIFSGEVSHVFFVWSTCWFTKNDSFEATTSGTRGQSYIPLDFNRPGCWLPVRFEMNEDGTLADLAASGTGVLEVGGVREMVSWDAVRYFDANDPRVCLRLNGRGIYGTSMVDWQQGGRFTVVSGARGSWTTVAMTLLTSSGLGGARGTYDTLGPGLGLGLDYDDIDISSLGLIGGVTLEAFAEDRTSFADMLAGWAALNRCCVVQRRGDDGKIRIAVVSTEPASDPVNAYSIDPNDVLMGGHSVPEKAPAPNAVKVEASVGTSTRTWLVRDLARAQAEMSPRTWTIKAPGCTETLALSLGGNLMRLADGQATLDIEVPPWVVNYIQPGDDVVLTTAHPIVYSWATGARAPSSLNAKVVGVGGKLAGMGRLTLLLAGQASESFLLCPAPVVTAWGSNGGVFYIRVLAREVVWFEQGSWVTLYNPGTEATETVTKRITDITVGAGATEAVIALSGAPPTWIAANRSRMTYPNTGVAGANQLLFMFVDATHYWR